MSRAVEQIAPTRQTNWDARAAANFICGGSGAGLLIAAAFAHWAGASYRPIAIVGLVLIAVGLTAVAAEIGRPLRALHVFFHARTSWMTREAMVAIALFAFGLAAVWLDGGAYAWFVALFAFAFLYCQARMLRAAKGIPAWREPALVRLIVLTGFAEGVGLLAFALAFADARRLAAWCALALTVSLVARALAWRSYRIALTRRGAPVRARTALDRLTVPFALIGSWAAAVVALAAAPLGAAWLGAFGGLVGAAAGWYFKFVLIMRAAYNQGFALPRMPVRGSGEPGPAAKPGW